MARYRPDVPDEIHRKASRIRGAAYALAGGATVYISVCLIGSALGALDDGTARDPFTDRPVSELDASCLEWTDSLTDLSDEARDSASYDVMIQSWRWRCGHTEGPQVEWLLEREPTVRFTR